MCGEAQLMDSIREVCSDFFIFTSFNGFDTNAGMGC